MRFQLYARQVLYLLYFLFHPWICFVNFGKLNLWSIKQEDVPIKEISTSNQGENFEKPPLFRQMLLHHVQSLLAVCDISSLFWVLPVADRSGLSPLWKHGASIVAHLVLRPPLENCWCHTESHQLHLFSLPLPFEAFQRKKKESDDFYMIVASFCTTDLKMINQLFIPESSLVRVADIINI